MSSQRGEFTYKRKSNRDIYGEGYESFTWDVRINGIHILGEANTVRQAYRHAKRAIRRYRKMWNHLNPNEPRI